MTTSTPAQVLNQTGPIFLDFDGPVTHLFVDGRNLAIADRMRVVLGSSGEPSEGQAASTYDPLIVLRWTYANRNKSTFAMVERACIEGEVEAVSMTVPTPGAHQFIKACAAASRPVIIVSNNAPQAIEAYLDRFTLRRYLTAVVAREPGNPDLMKPSRYLIDAALSLTGVSANGTAFVGDSLTDVEVGQVTGLRTIGFAKTPERGRELARSGASAITASMAELASVVRPPRHSSGAIT